MLVIWLSIGPKDRPKVENLAKAFSRTVGKERKRRVWPVGAVSKTITEYSLEGLWGEGGQKGRGGPGRLWLAPHTLTCS